MEMTKDCTALMERAEQRTAQIAADIPLARAAQPVRKRTEPLAPTGEGQSTHGPRRWNDPDEKLMFWGLLFFLGLGLYATAFVAFGVWLTP